MALTISARIAYGFYAVVAIGAFLLAPSYAWAGFEWMPPGSVIPHAQQRAHVVEDPLPMPEDMQAPTTKMIHMGKPEAKTAPRAPVSTAASPAATPKKPALTYMENVQGEKAATAKKATPRVKTSNMVFATAIGFGKSMPLALALTQVLPPHYSYSFSEGISPAAPVSWNGGKPWNQVVEEMIKPLGLDLYIEGRNVTIHRPTSTPPPSSKITVSGLDTISKARGPVFNEIALWRGNKGQDVQALLKGWSAKANVDLTWESAQRYTLDKALVMNDSFTNAVIAVFTDYLPRMQTPPSFKLVETPGADSEAMLVIKDPA